MRKFACLAMDTTSAHDFFQLESEYLGEDLTQVAMTKPQCASCHAGFREAAPAVRGLGQGTTFAKWLEYQPPDAGEEHYAGHTLTDLADFGAKLGSDPRVHRCEVKRLITYLYQRDFDTRDHGTLVKSLRDFYDLGLDLKESLRAIVGPSEYRWAVVSPKVKGDYLRKSTGVRFLNKLHWEGILEQLGPAAAKIQVPEDLVPGADETVTYHHGVPSGTYWHHTLALARKVAAAVVESELADETLPQSRFLLKEIPQGSGKGASTDQVMAQVRSLYWRLTGRRIEPLDERHGQYQAVWETALAGKTGDEDHRRAWRTMLTVLFSDYHFIRY